MEVEEEEGKKKKICTSQNKRIAAGRLREKVLTWIIPERTVTDAATTNFFSSSEGSSLSRTLVEFVEAITLVTTAPTIVLSTGNGPN